VRACFARCTRRHTGSAHGGCSACATPTPTHLGGVELPLQGVQVLVFGTHTALQLLRALLGCCQIRVQAPHRFLRLPRHGAGVGACMYICACACVHATRAYGYVHSMQHPCAGMQM